jgi:probable rRNA maturation factor
VDSPTDVLSFPSNEIDPQTNRAYIGDVVISFQRAKEQALDFKHSVMKEISILTIHGILHLFQYDHESQDDARKMFLLQDEIMIKLKINNL